MPFAGNSEVSEQCFANYDVLKQPLSNISMTAQGPVQAQTARDTENAHGILVGVESRAGHPECRGSCDSYSGASTTSVR